MPVRDQIFISYSHQDRPWLDKLKVHFDPLRQFGSLSYFDDTQIEAGDIWLKRIQSALARCRMAVLLVSGDFLASKFIRDHELPVLLEAARRGDLVLLTIPVSASNVDHTPLKDFQAARDFRKPLNLLGKPAQQVALVEICEKIMAAFNRAPVAPAVTGAPNHARAVTGTLNHVQAGTGTFIDRPAERGLPARGSDSPMPGERESASPTANTWKKLKTTDLVRLLDRDEQWDLLGQRLGTKRHGCILLWGNEDQHLHGFLERLSGVSHLPVRPLPPHRIVPVGLGRGELPPPSTAAKWKARFELAVESEGESLDGPWLRSQDRPVLFVLGEDAPVPEDLTGRDWEALVAFLAGDFTAWCEQCSRHKAFLWILIPMLCRKGDESARRARALVANGVLPPLMSYESELTLPTWRHLRQFIHNDFEPAPGRPRPDEERLRHLEERFEALRTRLGERLTFEDIAVFLYQKLY